MKKYHRYCAYCFEADDYRCSNHPEGKQPHWTEEQVKRETNCRNFVLSDMGDVIITGKQYHPRNNTRKRDNNLNVQFEQLSFGNQL